MDKTTQIRGIINNNRNRIAFVVGNGINRRFFKNDIPLWNDLIKNLAASILPKGQDAPNGISLTELFDLIELDATSYDGIIKEFVEYSKNNNINRYDGLSRTNSVDFDKVLEIVNSSYNSNNAVNHISQSKSLESFQKIYTEFIKGCRKWCMRNRDDYETLTDDQCVGHFMDVASNPVKIKMLKNIIKNEVVQTFSRKLKDPDLTSLMTYFRDLKTPILTTNFDVLMSQSLGLLRYNMGKSFTDFYPWSVYFSNKELEYPTSGFGIWHVNGIVEYPRSIKLGVSDYMGNVERARKMLQSHDFNEFFNGKNQTNWAGYNTWLHIIFNKDLFVFGLKLDKDEVFLRWLLIQRAKYSQMYNKGLRGWFVDYNISKATRFFLEHIGFEVINIRKHDTLYNALN